MWEDQAHPKHQEAEPCGTFNTPGAAGLPMTPYTPHDHDTLLFCIFQENDSLWTKPCSCTESGVSLVLPQPGRFCASVNSVGAAGSTELLGGVWLRATQQFIPPTDLATVLLLSSTAVVCSVLTKQLQHTQNYIKNTELKINLAQKKQILFSSWKWSCRFAFLVWFSKIFMVGFTNTGFFLRSSLQKFFLIRHPFFYCLQYCGTVK